MDFVIKGYPGTGRKVEDESDLSSVDAPDLLQGAFMGDAVMKLGDVDFSTSFGWLTLIDWCIRLTEATTELERGGSAVLWFSESPDYLTLRVHRDLVLASSSYIPGIAIVQRGRLAEVIREFVVTRMQWVAREFPGAMSNPAMEDTMARLGLPRP